MNRLCRENAEQLAANSRIINVFMSLRVIAVESENELEWDHPTQKYIATNS